MNQLGRALTEGDPPVKVLFVYNSNAAATSPDQRRMLRGLERDDLFTVVFEQVMTDTAHYADVLLPATTFLEGYDIARAYGPIGLRLAQTGDRGASVRRDRMPTSSANCHACLELRQETDPIGELEEMLDVFAKMPPAIGDALRDHGAAVPPHGGRPVQFVDVMPRTSDGKVDLFPAALDREAPGGALHVSPGSLDDGVPARADLAGERAHDQLDARGIAAAGSPPADAPERRCRATPRDGVAVRIFNALGEVRCNLQIGAWIRPGTVSLPKGLWRRHTANGYTANALVPDTLTDLGGGRVLQRRTRAGRSGPALNPCEAHAKRRAG